MAFWPQAHSDKCLFQVLIPGLTDVSLLESERGFEIVATLADTGKQSNSHLWFMSHLEVEELLLAGWRLEGYVSSSHLTQSFCFLPGLGLSGRAGAPLRGPVRPAPARTAAARLVLRRGRWAGRASGR